MLVVCYGKRRDPWQTLLKELILVWVKLMPVHFRDRPNDLRIAWSDAKQSLVTNGLVVWNRVSGLLSNVFCQLVVSGLESNLLQRMG